MAKNERTSPRIAKLAAKILDGYEPTLAEIKSIAASALTQTRDRAGQPPRIRSKLRAATNHQARRKPMSKKSAPPMKKGKGKGC